MKKLVAVGILCFAGSAVVAMSVHEATAKPPAVVVGTFDSRAVLFAHVGSEAFKSYLAAQKADLDRVRDRARAAGDKALSADLDALGPGVQRRIHEQGFGTAPVADILERIADRLPDVAAKAGVDVIISKWDLTYHRPSATFVDVTDLLVAEFHPDQETLKGIHEIVSQDPVPLDQIREEQ